MSEDPITEGVDESLSVNDLFRIPPNNLSRDQRDKIILALREARAKHSFEQAAAQARGGRTKKVGTLPPERVEEILKDKSLLDSIEIEL